jgi:hypothetical protein
MYAEYLKYIAVLNPHKLILPMRKLRLRKLKALDKSHPVER